jgi:hypothetical protein
MSIDLHNEKFLLQKLNYLPAPAAKAYGDSTQAGIHNNPCHPRWDLAAHSCDYLYSSAKFFYKKEKSFEILQHYADV